ncbi:DNA polymerase III subunit delta' [Sphingomicrobium nitratireducens]|uniref:DNA polymerase III subunit delta' n=1 Tax=Sphingomicrobium nitratireducens TaxID=2964666 RepID=UPI00223F2E6C
MNAAPIGQDKAVDAFLAAWRKGTPHHAWLLAGPRGVGKGLFARAAAARVLAEASGHRVSDDGIALGEDHPTAKLIAAGSHPDLRLLERLPNKTGTALARSISVDQVRSLGHLFEVTPSLGDWRVVIIDAADDLEGPAANALLKMLEEPPAKTLFFLVAHAPGRLLPTIRSRCRKLDFSPLSDDVMASILAQALPKSSPAERSALVRLGQGSAGRSVAIAEQDLAPLAEEARRMMREGDPTGAARAKLAKTLALKAASERYAAFLATVPGLIAAEARASEGERQVRALAAYEEARGIAQRAPRLSLDPGATVYRLGGVLAKVADTLA